MNVGALSSPGEDHKVKKRDEELQQRLSKSNIGRWADRS